MRAVSISIDNVKGIAGLITPGDRVDVIAVPSVNAGETPRGFAILRARWFWQWDRTLRPRPLHRRDRLAVRRRRSRRSRWL